MCSTMRRLKQTGDTIVEVLIAITILSFILGGAYVVVSKSATSMCTAQERGEAVTIAQGQVEKLRVAGANTRLGTNGRTFCFVGEALVPTPNNQAYGMP